MEPIKINVNVEVNLGEATLEAIKAVFGPQIRPAGHQIDFDSLESDTKPKKTKKPAAQPAPESQPQPQPQGADPDGTGAEDIGDLPPDDAPAPKPAPTESDARNAVQAARKRGVPVAKVKEYMKDTFGISSSVECPAERRHELIDGLNKLAA